MIAVAFTGIDHVGLSACRERGVEVRNCAGYSDVSVAELTLGLTIDVLRKVGAADAAVRAGQTSAGLMGTEICGKTVGIVGCGKIGCATGRLFKAFGTRVLGYARHEHPEAAEAGIEQVSLEQLLAESDIVSLHLPNNDTTRKSFGTQQFAQMKDGASLSTAPAVPSWITMPLPRHSTTISSPVPASTSLIWSRPSPPTTRSSTPRTAPSRHM